MFLVDAATQQLVKKLFHENQYVSYVKIFPRQGRVLVMASVAIVYDIASGDEIARFPLTGLGSHSLDLELSPDGQLALTDHDFKAIVWDTQTGRVVGQLAPQYQGETQSIPSAVFAADGRSVIAGSYGFNTPKNVKPAGYWWNPETGESRVRLSVPPSMHHHTPYHMITSPDRGKSSRRGPAGDHPQTMLALLLRLGCQRHVRPFVSDPLPVPGSDVQPRRPNHSRLG